MRRIPAETCLVLGFCLLAVSQPVFASESSIYDDLETVEVTGARQSKSTSAGTTIRFEAEQFTTIAPSALPDILVLLPSINIRTNSRGETLASIRGSGERQLALLWNGIPVNVPWDNRFDLGLIPSAGISSIATSTGATELGFGANTAGGVIDVRTDPVQRSHFEAQFGDGSLRQVDGAFAVEEQQFRQVIAFNHLERDGFELPEHSTAFSQESNGLITNTDRNATNLSVRSVLALEKVQLGFSALVSEVEFGIAPEQGARIDPRSARFWRFPDTNHSLMAVDAGWEVGKWNANVAFWTQGFDQTIQSFADANFEAVEETQLDQNRTNGAKLALTRSSSSANTVLSAMSFSSRHDEARSLGGVQAVAEGRFTHNQFSVAGDHSQKLSDEVSIAFGVGYDRFDPEKTAGRGTSQSFDGVSGSFNVSFLEQGGWQYRVGLARKVRLPTMRELFGEALGRFVLNPDLVPEKSWIFELQTQYSWNQGTLSITPFWTETNDTIEQTRATVGGDVLRQRVNLRGSRHFGVETRADVAVTGALLLQGYATWIRSRAKSDSVANTTRRRYLSDRPNWLARIEARYQLGTRTTFGLNVVYRGSAKSEADSGDFVDLSPATAINLSARHRLLDGQDGSSIELFAQVENLTDEFIEPQLGLPDAGRTLKLGLRALF